MKKLATLAFVIILATTTASAVVTLDVSVSPQNPTAGEDEVTITAKAYASGGDNVQEMYADWGEGEARKSCGFSSCEKQWRFTPSESGEQTITVEAFSSDPTETPATSTKTIDVQSSDDGQTGPDFSMSNIDSTNDRLSEGETTQLQVDTQNNIGYRADVEVKWYAVDGSRETLVASRSEMISTGDDTVAETVSWTQLNRHLDQEKRYGLKAKLFFRGDKVKERESDNSYIYLESSEKQPGADDATVEIRVRDNAGDRLRNAEVILDNNQRYGPKYTDSSGNVRFENVEPGRYDIEVNCGGSSQTEDYQRVREGSNSFDITLHGDLRNNCQGDTDDGVSGEPEIVDYSAEHRGNRRVRFYLRFDQPVGDYSCRVSQNNQISTVDSPVMEKISGSNREFSASAYFNTGTYTRYLGCLDENNRLATDVKRVRFTVREDRNGDDEPVDTQPDAEFTYGPINPEVKERVSFDASGSSGDIEEYRWRFGDGTTRTDDDPRTSHIYGSSGSYSVQLRVEDSDGDVDRTTRTVNVGERAQQCRISVNSLRLDPDAIGEGESSTASFTVTNTGEKDQDVSVRIYTKENTFYQNSFELSSGSSRKVESNVSVDEDRLVFARVRTEGNPCGRKTFTRSQELLFLGEQVGQSQLTVDVENQDGDAIENARVEVSNDNTRFDYTGSNGRTSFNLRPGDYTVTVSKDGYRTEQQSITLSDGDNRQLDFTLVRTDDREEEEAELRVHVEDDGNDELENAQVTVENGDDRVRSTDSNGDAEFTLEPDSYDIEVECRGETEKDDVDLESGDDETVNIDFDEDFDSDRCDIEDDDTDQEGLEIRSVNYPASVCRGSSFVADVTVDNNGGFHEVVTASGSGLGSINIGQSFTLAEGEQKTRSLRFTNVQGSGRENFDITVTNHDSDSVTRSIRVEDCGVSGTPGRASGISMELGQREVVIGNTVMVKGYVGGVRGRSEVTVEVNGRQEARISTQPDGYYQAFIRPEEPGEQTVTVKTNGASSSRKLRVIPTSTVLSVEAPQKVFEGETFEICADIESQVKPKLYLMKGNQLLETKYGKGEVCFERTASGTGKHKFRVRSLTYGREISGSTQVEILEAGKQVENFPDQVASVESEPGMVKVELYNTNNELRRYNLELFGVPSDWISQSEKQVLLDKGERKTVYFYLTPQTEGDFDPQLIVESEGELLHSQQIQMKVGGTKKPAKRNLIDRLRNLIRL